MPVKIGGEEWYTVKDCASSKGVSYEAMLAYVERHRSELRKVTIGRNVLFDLAELGSYRRRLPRRRK